MAKGVENNPKGKIAKIALRKRVMAWLTPAEARVFEAYAGSGMMWRAAWRGAADYVGCDVRPIYDLERPLYVAECERVLRAIDLAPFNVFDLDAFGSPWGPAWILANRRKLQPGERLAIITTDGAKLNARFGNLEKCFAHLTGQRRQDDAAHANLTALTRIALARVAEMMGGRLEWSDVRDNFGPSACQVYAAAGVVGLVAPVAAGEAAGVAGAGVAGGVMAEPVENACSAA